MVRPFLISVAACMALGAPAMAQDAAPEEGPSSRTLEGIAAIVNDEPISYSDVRQRARFLLLGLGRQQPTQEQVQQVTGQALEQLIDEQLQLQEAAEYEVEIEAAEIASAVSDMARQTGTDRDTLFEQLLAAGVNPSSLEDQMRAEIAWRRIMGGLYGSRIRVSENQIDDQVERMQAAAAETQFQVSEIFLFAPDETSKAQALEAAVSIREQLIQGAPFAVAAQRFSSSPTAATGGDMGWLALKDMDDTLGAAVAAMTEPGLSDPVTVDNGIYLLLVRGKREPEQKTSIVDLTRLVATDGVEATLQSAVETVDGCDAISSVAEADESLLEIPLGQINVDELGPEGASLVTSTPVGEATDIFAVSNGLAVMYVCARADDVDSLPTRTQIEDRLVNQQLGMISERTLRNLRREATIIRR